MRIYNDLLKKTKTRPCEVCRKSTRRHDWVDMNMLGVIFYCSNRDKELEQSKKSDFDGQSTVVGDLEVSS